MKPGKIITGPDGGVWGDKDACGFLARCSGETFNAYSRQRKPYGNPAPLPVHVDPVTQQKWWLILDVQEWVNRRPGSGRRVLETDSRLPASPTNGDPQ